MVKHLSVDTNPPGGSVGTRRAVPLQIGANIADCGAGIKNAALDIPQNSVDALIANFAGTRKTPLEHGKHQQQGRPVNDLAIGAVLAHGYSYSQPSIVRDAHHWDNTRLNSIYCTACAGGVNPCKTG